MTAPIDSSFFADPQGINALRREAKTQSPEALRETARQFESLFTQMMLKSMRSATPQDSLFGSDQQDFYQDMFDSQMATHLSQGKGLGLADMLVRQLMQAGVAPETAAKAVSAEQGTGGTVAAEAPARSGTAASRGMTRQEFIDAVRPAAQRVAGQLGVDPGTLAAHAALETGWGRALPRTADGGSSFNLFGLKVGSSWRGPSTASATHEFEGGARVEQVANFRAYGSVEECLQDYARVLGQNPRYAGALNTGSDAGAFAGALQRGGYATDPDYASKLASVARQLKSADAVPIPRTDTA